MINSVISALIAIFFWGKPNKKEKERIRKTSLIRTAIYLVLSIIVLVFYIKTNQVATIYNQLNIECGLADFNSNGEPLDTVYSVDIYNKFSSSSSYSNDITKFANQKYSEHGEVFSEKGGIITQIGVLRTKFDSIGYGRFFTKDYHNKLKKEVADVNHFFYISYVSTSIPSIIPIYPKQNERTRWINDSQFCFYRNLFENTRDNNKLFFYHDSEEYRDKMVDDSFREELPPIFENGCILSQEIGSRDLQNLSEEVIANEIMHNNLQESDIDKDRLILSTYGGSRFINYLNIFTAADISQYAYVFTSTSELPIKSIMIHYDVPIELPSSHESMTIGPTSIFIDGEYWNYFQQQSTIIYVKLPTLANVQLIRSFVLTTLLTILLSLFFRNIYFWMRKMAMCYKRHHSMAYSIAKNLSKIRIKIFKLSIYTIIISFFSVSLYFTWLVFHGKTLLISIDWLDNWKYILGGVIAFVVVVPWLLHIYASIPIKPKEKDENTNELQSYIDDLYEKKKNEEEEQLETLFNEHKKEILSSHEEPKENQE